MNNDYNEGPHQLLYGKGGGPKQINNETLKRNNPYRLLYGKRKPEISSLDEAWVLKRNRRAFYIEDIENKLTPAFVLSQTNDNYKFLVEGYYE